MYRLWFSGQLFSKLPGGTLLTMWAAVNPGSQDCLRDKGTETLFLH